MQKRVFFQNAAIMTATSLILRSIGILFRIYVSNRIGAEGMGLYQLIVSVYVLASSFATSGLTTAVTRVCTDELAYGHSKSAKHALYIAVLISVGLGFASGALVYGGSSFIAESFLHDSRAVSSLKILTFSLPFMGASSCIKGYFMARRKVTCSSVAQILEQLVRIGVILLILEMRHIDSVEESCYTVLLGDTIAEGISCLFMIISYAIDRKRLDHVEHPNEQHQLIRRILHIALPITGGRYLNSALRTIENILVPDTLFRFNGSRTTSLSQFGKLKGMALPLIFFPSSFLTAFTSLLIPEISEAKALSQSNRLHRTIDRAMHFTLLSSYLIAGVFYTFAYPISELVYHDREVGRMLLILAPLTPIMYLESVTVGILKGLNQQSHSLFYSVLDSVSRIAMIVTVVPSLGLDGFLGVMVFSNLLTCALNVNRLCKVSGVHIQIQKWIMKPLLALIIGIASSDILRFTAWRGLSNNTVYLAIRGLMICVLYCFLLPVFGCIKREDWIITKKA